MPKQSRRFELLLPTKFNNGQQVPSELFADTLLELEERFVLCHRKHKKFAAAGGIKATSIVIFRFAFSSTWPTRPKIANFSSISKSG